MLKGYIYLSITLLVLYGDLLKRFFPNEGVALGYLVAVGILLTIFLQQRRIRAVLGREAKLMSFFAFALIIIYALQLCTSFFSPFYYGLCHFLYMAIPLSFIVVLHRYAPEFDLVRLANIFLILMIPINIVGLIQYQINPAFMISTAYSETGGIIDRNFLVGSFFSRLPSLFASADRYSAMGLMQVFFSIVLLSGKGEASRKRYIWVGFNILMGFVALGIAGARSRILIAIVELALLATVQVLPMLKPIGVSARKGVRRLFILLMAASAVGFFLYLVYSPSSSNLPILVMLNQTFDAGDINVRMDEAVELSRPPEDLTLVGMGLGTQSLVLGKPGEFGIMSIWAESGMVWGIPLLIAFAGMIGILFRMSIKAAIRGKSVLFVMSSLPLMMLMFGLLLGLTGTFELSTGILLSCTIAAVSRMPSAGENNGSKINV